MTKNNGNIEQNVIIEINSDDSILSANTVFYKQTGYSDVTGMSVCNLITINYQMQWLTVRKQLNGVDTCQSELQFIRDDQSTLSYCCQIIKLPDNNKITYRLVIMAKLIEHGDMDSEIIELQLPLLYAFDMQDRRVKYCLQPDFTKTELQRKNNVAECDFTKQIHPADLCILYHSFNKLVARPQEFLRCTLRIAQTGNNWREVINISWVSTQNKDDSSKIITGLIILASKETNILRVFDLDTNQIMQSIPHGIAITNVSGEITFVNKNFIEISGYQSNELIGSYLYDFFCNEKDMQEFTEFCSYVETEEYKPAEMYYQFRKKDDSVIDIRLHWNYMRDAEQHITGFMFKVSDISEIRMIKNMINNTSEPYNQLMDNKNKVLLKAMTKMEMEIEERKKTEKLLKESESKLRSIIDNSQDGIFLTDETGTVIEWNKGQEQITGISREEVINRKASKIMSYILKRQGREVSEHKIEKSVNEILRTGQSNVLPLNKLSEYELFDIANNQHIVQTIEFVIPTSLGFRMASISRDVTEQRIKELRIKESEKQLRAIFDNSQQAFVVIDKELIIKIFNRRFYNNALELFGKRVQEGVGIHNIIPENLVDNFKQEFNKVLQGNALQVERCIHISNRMYKWYHFHYLPISDNNKVQEIFICITDIHKRKQAQEKIKKALHREQELNKLKSRFISVVSHEFRTPLAGIVSSAQLLEKYNAKWNEEQKNKVFGRIYKSANYLRMLLDELSVIGKDGSGKLDFQPEEINVEKFCKDIIDEVQLTFQETTVNFSMNLPQTVYLLDKRLLHHILINLLSNAIKYSPQYKDMKFSVSCINNRSLLFQVRDHGIGIPADDLAYLFEPFHRGKNVNDIAGTGLGLSIVKRCVELHKGQIQIESTPGKGTLVEVILPVIDIK